ncbi:DMT family transporter [Intrasporangium sp. YIM S08009]|uniref:DMT family transporter n=1 Tax=Intrasporangium zincisolvens TaxID=3080018 RepID=UPI002B0625D4|nr:DMT family transporter [Intrasporangium sp. YIM S08009]
MSRTLPATAALLAATAVWGSTFIITKDSLDELDPASFLTWRFGIGAAALLLVRGATVARLTRSELRRSGLLGVALAGGFLLQTSGLQHTLAGVSGFLTGAAVILTPVVAALVFTEQVGRAGWVAVALSTVGIAALAGGVGTPSVLGAALTLGGAACFAVHITGLSQWATRENAYGMTAVSVTVAAVLCAACAMATERGITVPATPDAWEAVLYLGIVATCIGFVVQAWAQSALTATAAAVVMTMEPVFAAVLAAAVGEAGLGWAGWAGGLLVIAGMTLAELGPRDCCDAMAPRVECC